MYLPLKACGHGTATVLMCMALLALPLGSSARHLSRAEVDALIAECEAAREEKLAPLREQAIDACVMAGVRDQAACRRKHRDFGAASRTRSGTIPRRFHDLSECKVSDEAHRHARLYPR